MTNDEILAALENARMDLERARKTLDFLPLPYDVPTYLLDTIFVLDQRISILKRGNDDPAN